jgi:hypothetical protein
MPKINLIEENLDEKSKDSDIEASVLKQNLEKSQLIKELHQRFRISNDEYYLIGSKNELAWKEKNSKLVTQLTDEKIAKGMILHAQVMGWNKVKVTGHDEFKQMVWLQAQIKGMDVNGYEPSEKDKMLAQALNPIKAKDNIKQNYLSQKYEKQADNPKKEKNDQRVYEGIILNYGKKNYNFDPDENMSYYIKIENKNGTQTVWGMDIERAIQETNSKPGDYISLENKGKKEVVVKVPEKDPENKIIGWKEISSYRNDWHIQKNEKTDRHKIVESAADLVFSEKTANQKVKSSIMKAINLDLYDLAKINNIPDVPIYMKDDEIKKNRDQVTEKRKDIEMERSQ